MYKRQHTWKKESPEAFNIKIQIGISQEPPGKDSKKVRIAYFHIWFQWDLCQIILLFDKSNPKKYFVFPGCLEISLKFTYKHTDTTYHLPVVWDQMRKQGPGPPEKEETWPAVGGEGGWGGHAVAYLSIPVPTNLEQAICFQPATNQEMALLKYPVGSNETYPQKSWEHHHGPASSHEKCHSWTSKGTAIVIF